MYKNKDYYLSSSKKAVMDIFPQRFHMVMTLAQEKHLLKEWIPISYVDVDAGVKNISFFHSSLTDLGSKALYVRQPGFKYLSDPLIWQLHIAVSVELPLLTDLIASYRRPQIWAAKVPSTRFILNPRKIKVGGK